VRLSAGLLLLPELFIDVAHNPEAAVELARRVAIFSRQPVAVCACLKDKDIDGVMDFILRKFF